MAVLILNANSSSPVSISVSRAGRTAPSYVGSKSQSFAGAERSSIRGLRRSWQCVTIPVTDTVRASIEDITSRGAQLPCSGDLFGGIQTQCSIEVLGVEGVAGLSLWIMSLGLSETQSSQVLLRWSPGDTITGESFTRSTTATYITAGGVVATAAINAKRDAHLATTATGGAIVLLLEDTRTNALSRSQEFDNAAWTKGNATITANAVNGPDGTATADKLSEDASAGTAHYALRSGLTTTASTPQSVSIFAKAAERSWVRLTTSDRAGVARHSWINISSGASGTTDSGHTVRTTALTSSWYRIELVFNSGVGAGSVDWYTVLATADAIQTYNGVAGNGCYVWGGQHEQDSSFASSYIPTVAGAVTRAADYYSLPFTAPPQEISVYAKFVESGTTGVVNGRVFEIASAANADPLLTGWASSGHYSSNHEVAAVGATSTLATAPVLRDTAEVDFRLFGDGSVDTTQSINSGSSTTATQSSSLALQTAWSGPLCWLNSGGTVGGIGFTGIQSFKIVAGARSLSELRAA